MDLFIYLQIASIETIQFAHPLQSWINKSYPGTICFDADNHSDDIVINYGLEQLEQAEKIAVLIEAQPGKKLGGTLRLIEKLIRAKEKEIDIFFNGKHSMIEKMIRHGKGQVLVGLSDKEIREIVQR